MEPPFEPAGIRLGVARGITYGLFGPPDEFMGPLRDLGAGLVRVSLYWNQVQPEPGRFDWSVVDAFLDQLTGDEEVWVTVCSSSMWATKVRTDFLPPSPAHDHAAYRRFVRALVAHCGGRVQYWQCNNEPSNVGLLWAGTAEDYVAQLEQFHAAVRDADPTAAVVLGGCGYDVLASEPDGPARQFFEHLVDRGRDLFDLFALHLYDDPTAIPTHLQTVRSLMNAHGYERPVVIGEYNGPTLFQLPELDAVLQQTMMSAFSEGTSAELDTSELAAQAARETPERRAMRSLYAAMAALPESLQMFMVGCAPELDARRHRINCREIVSRNLFALAGGVRRTVCWLLAPEVPNYEDPFTMMELMHGKLPLLGYDGTVLSRPHPSAATFRQLAAHLDGAVAVARLERSNDGPDSADGPDGFDGFVFVIDHGDDPPTLVVWLDRDLVHGEDDPPTAVTLPWAGDHAVAVDALGRARPTSVHDGVVELQASVTPTFIAADATRHAVAVTSPPTLPTSATR